jgi:hypothetical protein
MSEREKLKKREKFLDGKLERMNKCLGSSEDPVYDIRSIWDWGLGVPNIRKNVFYFLLLEFYANLCIFYCMSFS